MGRAYENIKDVVTHAPRPIAFAASRVLEHEDPSARTERLIHLGEAIVRYLTCVSLAEYITLEPEKMQIGGKLAGRFTSFGSWVQALGLLDRELQGLARDPLGGHLYDEIAVGQSVREHLIRRRQLPRTGRPKVITLINSLVPIRNDRMHGRVHGAKHHETLQEVCVAIVDHFAVSRPQALWHFPSDAAFRLTGGKTYTTRLNALNGTAVPLPGTLEIDDPSRLTGGHVYAWHGNTIVDLHPLVHYQPDQRTLVTVESILGGRVRYLPCENPSVGDAYRPEGALEALQARAPFVLEDPDGEQRSRARDLEHYQEQIELALADGVLSADEAAMLNATRERFGLAVEDVRQLHEQFDLSLDSLDISALSSVDPAASGSLPMAVIPATAQHAVVAAEPAKKRSKAPLVVIAILLALFVAGGGALLVVHQSGKAEPGISASATTGSVRPFAAGSGTGAPDLCRRDRWWRGEIVHHRRDGTIRRYAGAHCRTAGRAMRCWCKGGCGKGRQLSAETCSVCVARGERLHCKEDRNGLVSWSLAPYEIRLAKAAIQHNTSAYRAYKSGDFQRAKQLFRKAVRIDPLYAKAFYNLACTYGVIRAKRPCEDRSATLENMARAMAKAIAVNERWRRQLDADKDLHELKRTIFYYRLMGREASDVEDVSTILTGVDWFTRPKEGRGPSHHLRFLPGGVVRGWQVRSGVKRKLSGTYILRGRSFRIRTGSGTWRGFMSQWGKLSIKPHVGVLVGYKMDVCPK